MNIPLFIVTIVTAATGIERVDPPAAARAMAPNLAGHDNAPILSWLETVERDDGHRGHRLRMARFVEGRWTAPSTIVERDDFFANWADLPSVARVADGALIAHWLQKSSDDTYAYDVALARSDDDGSTWRLLGTAHDDGTHTEHGFVSLVTEGASSVRAFWLDGREMAAGHDHDTGHGTGDMTLRTATIAGAAGPATVLDERVCECCNTSAAVTDEGPFVVYRDRSAEEVRDISIVRMIGDAWTAPRTIHDDGWQTASCPVNGPAAAARGRRAAVAWYTNTPTRAVVRVAFSEDAAETFAPPVTVDDTHPMGRVDVALSPAGEAFVCWLDADRGTGAIQVRRVAPDGRTGAPLLVTETSLARTSGFPRMVMLNDALLLVWTEADESTSLRAAVLPLAEVPPLATAVTP